MQASTLLEIHKTIFNTYIIGNKSGDDERDAAVELFKQRIKSACADELFDVQACSRIAKVNKLYMHYFSCLFMHNALIFVRIS